MNNNLAVPLYSGYFMDKYFRGRCEFKTDTHLILPKRKIYNYTKGFLNMEGVSGDYQG
jgi:hypothetical protein